MSRFASLSLVAFVFVMSAGCVGEDEDFSTTDQASHSWGGYHWARTANPFTLSVGDNVTSEWDGILDTTVADWTQSTALNLNKVAGQATTKRCKPTAGRVEVCNARYGNNGWLGIASISVNGGHITQGTVKLNDTYFQTAQYNTTAWRNMVSCQEVGHTLGLDHQDENFDNPNLNTCMDYTSNPGSNQHPNSHDYNQLQDIYQHLDSSTTVGAAVPGPSAEQSEEWGELVASSHGGHVETYVHELGNDRAVVTHVIWVDE